MFQSKIFYRTTQIFNNCFEFKVISNYFWCVYTNADISFRNKCRNLFVSVNRFLRKPNRTKRVKRNNVIFLECLASGGFGQRQRTRAMYDLKKRDSEAETYHCTHRDCPGRRMSRAPLCVRRLQHVLLQDSATLAWDTICLWTHQTDIAIVVAALNPFLPMNASC